MPSVIDMITAASSVIAKIDSVEDKARLSELVNRLREMDLENEKLRDENKLLTVKLSRRKDLERISASYYLIEKDGEKTGPLCPHCYEEQGIVHLLLDNREGAKCTGCLRVYAGVKTSYKPRTSRVL
jgi:hypothetical protein